MRKVARITKVLGTTTMVGTKAKDSLGIEQQSRAFCEFR